MKFGNENNLVLKFKGLTDSLHEATCEQYVKQG